MAKQFKLRLSRVIPSFQSCRSTDPVTNPLPPAFHLSPINPKAIDIDFPASPRATNRRRAPVVSVGCGCGSSRSGRRNPYANIDADTDDLSMARGTPAYLWRQEEKWHSLACVGSPRRKIDSEDGGFFPAEIGKRVSRRRRGIKKKKVSRSGGRISTSSAWFSSEEDDYNYGDDEDETKTLISSSRGFSTDSFSDFNSRLDPLHETSDYGVFRRKQMQCPSPETGSPGRANAAAVLRRMVPAAAEGKVRESFAVVKRSEDPYGDFRRSMAEMILEKEMYEERELEELLHCFLSLNARHHHHAIVSAFSEIWNAIFPTASAFSTIF